MIKPPLKDSQLGGTSIFYNKIQKYINVKLLNIVYVGVFWIFDV